VADTCVSRVPLFAGLSAPEQQQVAGLARPTHLVAGETAYGPGDAAAQLVVVHTGRLKIVRLSPDGSEQIVRILGPGEFTGEAALFTGERPDHFATALDDCRLCVFRHDDLEALVRTHPGIGLRMLATVSARLAATEYRLNALTARDVDTRVADYLLGLPTTRHDDVAVVTLPLAKKDVASLLDTSPESLSRALARLAARGLIAVGTGRAISITEPEGLQQLVDGA
jgi:CRP/FNR family transcriptional regulator, anaerobic regulatory protein